MWQRILDAIFGKAKPNSARRSTELDAENVIDRLNAHSQLCVRAFHSDKACLSKLGGIPTVPDQFDWPEWNGASLQFLCQIDLKEVQKVVLSDWLPADGLLSFYYDAEQSTWGFDPNDKGSWRVEHFAVNAGLSPASLPHSAAGNDILPEVFLSFESAHSVPKPERIGLQYDQVPEKAWEYVYSQDSDNSTWHQIGGWPRAIQGDGMELECQLASNGVYVGDAKGYQSDMAKRLSAGSKQWRLLLQLDSDENAGMQWGDVGRLYFWVKEAETAKGDFSGAWMILQC